MLVKKFLFPAENVIFSLSLQQFNIRQHYNNSQYYDMFFIVKIYAEVLH